MVAAQRLKLVLEPWPLKKDLFRGVENPFEATRYHSLIVQRDTIPPELVVTAWTAEGEVMGLRHRELPIEAVRCPFPDPCPHAPEELSAQPDDDV